MKTVWITGASGFIGHSLVKLLSGYNIISTDHKDLDLTNLDAVKDFFDDHKDIDFVIHTATSGGGKREDHPGVFYDNTKMFENLRLFRNKYKLLILFGSGAESGAFPLNYYGLSKTYITKKIYAQDLNMINLRLWGCFGAHEDPDRFIKANMIRYKNKHPMILHNNRLMDFFYIEDLIPIIDYFFGMYQHDFTLKDYNLVYPKKYNLRQIANIINTLEDYKVDIIQDSFSNVNPYIGEGTAVPFILTNNMIGLEEGIKRMWNEI